MFPVYVKIFRGNRYFIEKSLYCNAKF